MKGNRSLYILFGLITAFFVFRWIFFENKEVPAINFESRYDYNGKDGEDLWLLKTLLDKEYESIKIDSKIERYDSLDNTGSILIINDYIHVSEDEADSLFRIIENGKTLFISGEEIHFEHESFDISIHKRFQIDSLQLNFKNSFRVHNQLKEFHNPTWAISDLEIVNNYGYGLGELIEMDLYLDPESNHLDNDSTKLDQIHDTLMQCFIIDQGKLCFHKIPYLFTNIASKDNFYLEHYRSIRDVLGPGPVYLTKNSIGGRKASSPLRYILAHRGLKWAFFTLLVSLLLFLLSNSKRRQKEIPLLHKKKNTSLDFVDTVSRLYQSQRRNDKLSQKMEDNFYYFVENRYYLKKTNDSFWEKLLQKSKVQQSLLTRIQNEFNSIHSENESDKEILSTYNILNMFYKTAE